jgi:uncharacterized damage-inducible protein DinB
MLEYFVTLYDYNYWANERILRTAENVSNTQFVAPAPFSWGGLRGTLVHTMSAEWVWRSRWQGVSPTGFLHVEDFPTVAALGARWRDEETKMREFLATLTESDLTHVVNYKRTSGGASSEVLWQLMAHLVNHGTQHRAEAAAILSGLGHSPGDVDFIVFARERQGRR